MSTFQLYTLRDIYLELKQLFRGRALEVLDVRIHQGTCTEVQQRAEVDSTERQTANPLRRLRNGHGDTDTPRCGVDNRSDNLPILRGADVPILDESV